MNRQISRSEKRKYSNEGKLALGEDKNTSALINIALEDRSNSSRFCLLDTFAFILLLLHTLMFLIL